MGDLLALKETNDRRKTKTISKRKRDSKTELSDTSKVDNTKTTNSKHQLPMLTACLPRKQFVQMRKNYIDKTYFFNARELRRRKEGLASCIYHELLEDGFYDAGEYFMELIRENDEILKKDEIGIAVDIKKRKIILELVATSLKNASIARGNDDRIGESSYFLALAMELAELEKGVLWVAEKCFLLAFAVAAQSRADGGKQEAACLYAHGRFILDKFPSADMSEADEMLKSARHLSNGKVWKLDDYIIQKETTKSIFANSSALLHKILICHAQNWRLFDPFYSERLCGIALRRGSDAEMSRLVVTALTEMGISQTKTNDLTNALQSFKSALFRSFQDNHIIGICNSFMHLAATLLRSGEEEYAVKALTRMGSLAASYGLNYQLGRALHLLGELYLIKHRPRSAATHLSEAFTCFNGDFHHTAIVHKPRRIQQLDETDSTDLNLDKVNSVFQHISKSSQEKDQPSKHPSIHKQMVTESSGQLDIRVKINESTTSNESMQSTIPVSEVSNKQYVASSISSESGREENSTSMERSSRGHYSFLDVPLPAIEPDLRNIYPTAVESMKEDAEQSRFLNAVASGQFRMESYFDTLDKCGKCNVAVGKILNWKSTGWSWLIPYQRDDLIPCHCPYHKRTALDVVLQYNNQPQTQSMRTKEHLNLAKLKEDQHP